MVFPVSTRRIPGLLRAEINRRKLTQYRIALDTGIKQPCLSRFLNGGSLKIESAAVLLDYLGFELTRKAAMRAGGAQVRRRGRKESPSALRNRRIRKN